MTEQVDAPIEANVPCGDTRWSRAWGDRMKGQRRHVGVAAAMALAMISGNVGSAVAAEPVRHPSVQKRLSQLADANRPAGTLKARADRSGVQAPERSRTPEEYLRAAGDLRDPRNYAKAARAMTEATWGISLPDARSHVAAEEGADNTIRYGLPAGDLTGDGLDDALSLEYRWLDWDIEFLSLRAFRGTDGTELWSVPLSGAYDVWPLLVGDLTGDGAEDILLARMDVDASYLGGCAVLACAVSAEATYAWTYTAISGLDGATAWARTYDGEAEQQYVVGYALVVLGAVMRYTATEAVVFPALSGDHDGDGVPDLVFNGYDLTLLYGLQYAGFYVGALAYENYGLLTSRGEIVSGVSGSAALLRSRDEAPGGAWLYAVGDAVGDATSDLVWATLSEVHTPLACVFALVAGRCAQVAQRSMDIEMIDGSTLSTSWSVTIDDDTTTDLGLDTPGGDLTGDGKTDLVLYELHAVDGILMSAVSGATGARVWTRAGSGYLDVIGEVGGGPGSDLLSLRYDWDFSTDGVIVSLERIDGATGDTLLVTEHRSRSPEDGFVDLYAYLAGDTDKDGAADIGLDTITYGNTMVSRTIVESGATGAPLYERSAPGFVATYPGGDMDGDGAQDLLALGVEGMGDVFDVTFTGLSVLSGELWSRTDGFGACFGLAITLGGDQSGLGGDDQIYSRYQCLSEREESRIDGVEQTTGAITWGHGPPLTTPDTFGSISGTVLEGDGAPARVCIDAFREVDGDFRWVGGAISDEDGRYRIRGLRTGEYKIWFWDCDRDELKSEYYDDKENIDDADPVAVTMGVETSGIDATLARGGGTPPPNDNFADGESLSSPTQAAASTIDATTERGEPQPSCGTVGRTVWYRFTAVETGTVEITTAGSSYDTVLGVYTGSDLSSLDQITCSDDVALSRNSAATFLATAGETYHIQAGGWFGGRGDLVLTLV
jgi:hypothetical protein